MWAQPAKLMFLNVLSRYQGFPLGIVQARMPGALEVREWRPAFPVRRPPQFCRRHGYESDLPCLGPFRKPTGHTPMSRSGMGRAEQLPLENKNQYLAHRPSLATGQGRLHSRTVRQQSPCCLARARARATTNAAHSPKITGSVWVHADPDRCATRPPTTWPAILPRTSKALSDGPPRLDTNHGHQGDGRSWQLVNRRRCYGRRAGQWMRRL